MNSPLLFVLAFVATQSLSSCTLPSATVEVRDGKRVTRVKIPQQSIISFTFSAAGGVP